jgi:hypothetical protein
MRMRCGSSADRLRVGPCRRGTDPVASRHGRGGASRASHRRALQRPPVAASVAAADAGCPPLPNGYTLTKQNGAVVLPPWRRDRSWRPVQTCYTPDQRATSRPRGGQDDGPPAQQLGRTSSPRRTEPRRTATAGRVARAPDDLRRRKYQSVRPHARCQDPAELIRRCRSRR